MWPNLLGQWWGLVRAPKQTWWEFACQDNRRRADILRCPVDTCFQMRLPVWPSVRAQEQQVGLHGKLAVPKLCLQRICLLAALCPSYLLSLLSAQQLHGIINKSYFIGMSDSHQDSCDSMLMFTRWTNTWDNLNLHIKTTFLWAWSLCSHTLLETNYRCVLQVAKRFIKAIPMLWLSIPLGLLTAMLCACLCSLGSSTGERTAASSSEWTAASPMIAWMNQWLKHHTVSSTLCCGLIHEESHGFGLCSC